MSSRYQPQTVIARMTLTVCVGEIVCGLVGVFVCVCGIVDVFVCVGVWTFGKGNEGGSSLQWISCPAVFSLELVRQAV